MDNRSLSRDERGVRLHHQDGSEATEFAQLVMKNWQPIFRYLTVSLRDADLAESLTQECFLKAQRNWHQFRGDANASTWLMRIAINLKKDLWRNRRHRFWEKMRTHSVDANEASDWLPGWQPSPEHRLLVREQIELVWKAMECLTRRQRTIVQLRLVDELQLADIAEATGLQLGTVKALLCRALANLRAVLLQDPRFEPQRFGIARSNCA